jgi:hypothetical protein
VNRLSRSIAFYGADTGTFGVEGNYDGGTNGKEIGNVARHACTGSWIVKPSQVVRDYGE